MLTTTVRGKAPAILGTACAVLMATGGLAVAQDDQRRLDRSTEKIDFVGDLPDRPKLVGDSLEREQFHCIARELSADDAGQ